MTNIQHRQPKLKREVLDRENFIYGFCRNSSTGEIFAFNRDYLVLPRRPTEAQIDEVLRFEEICYPEHAAGHGRFRPNIGDERVWDTHIRNYLAKEWINSDYERKHYEDTTE